MQATLELEARSIVYVSQQPSWTPQIKSLQTGIQPACVAKIPGVSTLLHGQKSPRFNLTLLEPCRAGIRWAFEFNLTTGREAVQTGALPNHQLIHYRAVSSVSVS